MALIVPFNKKYAYSRFDCGVPALNNYLKAQARQDSHNHYNVIFVALRPPEAANKGEKIAGFYTLYNAGASLNEIARYARKKLPQYLCVPAIRLGRLAVDKSAKKHGLGKALLADAITRSMKVPDWMLMFADTDGPQASAFYKKYGFTAVGDGLSLVMLRSTLVKHPLFQQPAAP